MRSIAVYVEGGGDTAQQKAELRVGLDRLLAVQKDAARAKRLGWKLVPCGARSSTFRAFRNAVRNADGSTLCGLLVDSEDGLPSELSAAGEESAGAREHREGRNAIARRDHLVDRDGWDLLQIEADRVHLMVVCMETWIVADPDAMASYYGPGFRRNALPRRRNLEDEPKSMLYAKLAAATRDTGKGEYSEANHAKIRHASKLLARLNPAAVADRCPRFATFTSWLGRQIRES